MSPWSIAIIAQVIIAVVLGTLIPVVFSVVVNLMTAALPALCGREGQEGKGEQYSAGSDWVVC